MGEKKYPDTSALARCKFCGEWAIRRQSDRTYRYFDDVDVPHEHPIYKLPDKMPRSYDQKIYKKFGDRGL